MILIDATTPVALLSIHDLIASQGWDADAAQAEVDAEVTWPDVPLVVLSHDPASAALQAGPTAEMLWIAGQEEYTALTPGGTFKQVPDAGLYIDRDAPNRVIAAIDALVAAAG